MHHFSLQPFAMLSPQPEVSSISDVERDTGVAKETLRVWERRYAFPQPLRDVHGERVYPLDQVQKLRLVQRLLDLGCRPGKIMQLDHASLSQMAQERCGQAAPNEDASPTLQRYLAMIKAHQMPELRQQLAQLQLQIGIEGLVRELLAPLTTRVGLAWASELAVYEEHLYTESVQTVLHNALFALSQHRGAASGSPRVLLTTVPQEQHALGLLMAETMLSLHGAHCISLGVQTPISEIVAAAASQRADIVALSFSSAIPLRDTLRSLDELRARLPATIEIWAGGSRANEGRRKIAPPLAQVLDLDGVAASLERWRLAKP
jgi:DNA-binding transcriptional MerR regulator/methylmalonyl-CoA mutase cobalamin-binding subunit